MVVMDVDEENIEEVAASAEESINDGEEVGDVKDDLMSEIITTIEFLDQISDYRRTQQKECFNLVRRLKILIPFMDEIRGFEFPSPESCMHFLHRLRKVILAARKLLETCNNGSKIYLVRKLFSFFFQNYRNDYLILSSRASLNLFMSYDNRHWIVNRS